MTACMYPSCKKRRGSLRPVLSIAASASVRVSVPDLVYLNGTTDYSPWLPHTTLQATPLGYPRRYRLYWCARHEYQTTPPTAATGT